MEWIPWAYLGISLASLAVQATALVGITAGTRATPPGLARTAWCRVGTATAYVSLAMVALLADPSVVAVTALVIAGGVQLAWQANAVADVALRRSLGDSPGRHRR